MLFRILSVLWIVYGLGTLTGTLIYFVNGMIFEDMGKFVLATYLKYLKISAAIVTGLLLFIAVAALLVALGGAK